GGPGIYTTPGLRRARRRHTGWRRIVLPKGTRLRAHDRGQGGLCGERHRGPRCSSWLALSNAVGTPLPALPSEERKHEPRFLLPRSQATSLVVSPLTRNSLAGAARSWPMSEAESERRVDRMLHLTCVLVLRRLPPRPWSCGP